MKARFPFAHSLFMRIAEPRVIRIMQFGIYLCMASAGFGVLTNTPATFENVIGLTMVYVFGGFISVGSVLGAIAVLPGIWWLERVGILALTTGMAMYAVVVVALNGSPVGLAMAVAFGLSFIQRWMEIRRFQLAPREG